MTSMLAGDEARKIAQSSLRGVAYDKKAVEDFKWEQLKRAYEFEQVKGPEIAPFGRAACGWLDPDTRKIVKRSANKRGTLYTGFGPITDPFITADQYRKIITNELTHINGVAHKERLPMDGVEPVGWTEVERRLEKMEQNQKTRRRLLPFSRRRRECR